MMIRISKRSQYPLPVVHVINMGGSFGWDCKNRGFVFKSGVARLSKAPPKSNGLFCSPSQKMMMPPYKCNVSKEDCIQGITNQPKLSKSSKRNDWVFQNYMLSLKSLSSWKKYDTWILCSTRQSVLISVV